MSIGASFSSPLLTKIPSICPNSHLLAHRCSIIIIDTNPFAGDHLRLLMMQSDYFAVMAGPDQGSTNAIQKLCAMVPDPWYTNTNKFTEKRVNQTVGFGRQYPFLLKKPKFLGVILGNWQSKNNAAEDGMTVFSQGLSCDVPSLKYQAMLSLQWHEAIDSRKKLLNYKFTEVEHGIPDATISFSLSENIYRDLHLVDSLLGRVRFFSDFKINSEHFGVPVPFLKHEHLGIEWNNDGNVKKQRKVDEQKKKTVMFFRKVRVCVLYLTRYLCIDSFRMSQGGY